MFNYSRTALVNQNEDYPGMQFLNSAFDSSTFIRTNYNYIQSLAALAGATGMGQEGGAGGAGAALALSSASHSANSSMANLNSSITGMTNAIGGGGGGGGGGAGGSTTGGVKASSFILPGTSSSTGIAPSQSMANANPNVLSSSNNLLATAKSSISTNHHGMTTHASGAINGSVSSKTAEGRTLWLQHLATAAANASSKRNYCSKTQVYCEAVSRALDIHTCKVVPFFGAFLHDLRFIIESVPSIGVMCNTIVQKPIEVLLFILFNFKENISVDFNK